MKRKELVLALFFSPALVHADYRVFYDPATGEIAEVTLAKKSGSANAASLSMAVVPDDDPIITEGRKIYKVNNGVIERKSDGEIAAQKADEDRTAAIEQAINLKNRKQALDALAVDGMDVSAEQTEIQGKLDSVIASPELKVK